MKKLTIAIASLAMLSAPAFSDTYYISLEKGLYTNHFTERGNGKEWNEDNKLIGFEVGKGDWSIQYSQFNNSYGVDTQTYGVQYNVYSIHNFSLLFAAGIADGYTDKQLPTCFSQNKCVYVAPSIKYEWNVNENISFSPVVRWFGEAYVINAQVTVKF